MIAVFFANLFYSGGIGRVDFGKHVIKSRGKDRAYQRGITFGGILKRMYRSSRGYSDGVSGFCLLHTIFCIKIHFTDSDIKDFFDIRMSVRAWTSPGRHHHFNYGIGPGCFFTRNYRSVQPLGDMINLPVVFTYQ